mmetsp:Transcript_44559/g.129565  ORF Transcript_44559/g.129565 Transcript_44559/m.129565 type:complete len:562 (-) Transcript_44559:2-1687(-)
MRGGLGATSVGCAAAGTGRLLGVAVRGRDQRLGLQNPRRELAFRQRRHNARAHDGGVRRRPGRDPRVGADEVRRVHSEAGRVAGARGQRHRRPQLLDQFDLRALLVHGIALLLLEVVKKRCGRAYTTVDRLGRHTVGHGESASRTSPIICRPRGHHALAVEAQPEASLFAATAAVGESAGPPDRAEAAAGCRLWRGEGRGRSARIRPWIADVLQSLQSLFFLDPQGIPPPARPGQQQGMRRPCDLHRRERRLDGGRGSLADAKHLSKQPQLHLHIVALFLGVGASAAGDCARASARVDCATPGRRDVVGASNSNCAAFNHTGARQLAVVGTAGACAYHGAGVVDDASGRRPRGRKRGNATGAMWAATPARAGRKHAAGEARGRARICDHLCPTRWRYAQGVGTWPLLRGARRDVGRRRRRALCRLPCRGAVGAKCAQGVLDVVSGHKLPSGPDAAFGALAGAKALALRRWVASHADRTRLRRARGLEPKCLRGNWPESRLRGCRSAGGSARLGCLRSAEAAPHRWESTMRRFPKAATPPSARPALAHHAPVGPDDGPPLTT